jgi:hypothetical protein
VLLYICSPQSIGFFGVFQGLSRSVLGIGGPGSAAFAFRFMGMMAVGFAAAA